MKDYFATRDITPANIRSYLNEHGGHIIKTALGDTYIVSNYTEKSAKYTAENAINIASPKMVDDLTLFVRHIVSVEQYKPASKLIIPAAATRRVVQ